MYKKIDFYSQVDKLYVINIVFFFITYFFNVLMFTTVISLSVNLTIFSYSCWMIGANLSTLVQYTFGRPLFMFFAIEFEFSELIVFQIVFVWVVNLVMSTVCLGYLMRKKKKFAQIYDRLGHVDFKYSIIKSLLKKFNHNVVFYIFSVLLNNYLIRNNIQIIQLLFIASYRKVSNNFQDLELNSLSQVIKLTNISGIILGNLLGPITKRFIKNSNFFTILVFVIGMFVSLINIIMNYFLKRYDCHTEIFEIIILFFQFNSGFCVGFFEYYSFLNVFRNKRVTRDEKELAILMLRTIKFLD